MEVTLELVEQLRQHADVSYEEARAALEHSGGDLLEALIWLERMGKIGGGDAKVGEYHTGPDAPFHIEQHTFDKCINGGFSCLILCTEQIDSVGKLNTSVLEFPKAP